MRFLLNIAQAGRNGLLMSRSFCRFLFAVQYYPKPSAPQSPVSCITFQMLLKPLIVQFHTCVWYTKKEECTVRSFLQSLGLHLWNPFLFLVWSSPLATLSVHHDKMHKRDIEMSFSDPSIFWTDSMSVLRYVKNDSKRFHILSSQTALQQFEMVLLQTSGITERVLWIQVIIPLEDFQLTHSSTAQNGYWGRSSCGRLSLNGLN